MADDKMKKFEDNLAELEELVRALERDIPLDEAIESFGRGIELAKLCMEELKAEKGKLEILVDEVNKITEEFHLDK